MMPRRRLAAVVATTAVAGLLALGLPTAANAATVTGAGSNGLQYQADDANVAAGATVTGYTGTSTVLVIPATVVINGVTYAVTTIGPDLNDVFEDGGTSLTSLVMPDSITSIGDRAFFGNTSLTSVTFGSGLTYIGDHAFASDPLGTLTLPPHVTEILGNVFAQDSLTSVTLSSAMTYIHGAAFAGNDLTSVIIPANVNQIDSTAFSNNPGLTSVTFVGAAPTSIEPADSIAALGTTPGLVVSYLWAHDAAQQAGGFTTPTWQGYNTRELVTRTFDANGFGTAPAGQRFTDGAAAAAPANPVAAGEAFQGWFTTAALATKVNFADPVTADETIYAGWARLATTGVSVGPGNVLPGFGALLLGAALLAVARTRRRLTRA